MKADRDDLVILLFLFNLFSNHLPRNEDCMGMSITVNNDNQVFAKTTTATRKLIKNLGNTSGGETELDVVKIHHRLLAMPTLERRQNIVNLSESKSKKLFNYTMGKAFHKKALAKALDVYFEMVDGKIDFDDDEPTQG